MNGLFDVYRKNASLIGFDDLFTRVEKAVTESAKLMAYPPYNLRKTGDNTYVIEMAVAGFGKSDIEITLDGDLLKIAGAANADATEEGELLFKGIAERAFERKFSVADTVVVKNAQMVNGILKVFLENVIPESKKPKRISVE
jgi:molecular chaperone IbpA